MALAPSRSGVVSVFDDRAGLGEVTDEDGAVHPFHCTAIVGGSRTIDPSTRVTYRVAPGRCGRWEAVELVVV